MSVGILGTEREESRRRRSHRRPSRVRARPVAAVLVVLALAAVGCGGSDAPEGSSSQSSEGSQGGSASASPSTWAEEVCSAGTDWKDAVDAARATLGDTANLSANGVRDALDEVGAATDSLVTALTGLGPPDTEAGDQATAELSALAAQLQQQKDTITGAASQSPSNARQLLTQVSTVTGALAAMLTGVTATVQDLGKLDGAEELTDAFRTAPACRQLSASASASPGS